MALGQYLTQKQTQKLIITQDLRQSIELLQLSATELAAKIEEELIENPMLEEGARKKESPEVASGTEPPPAEDSGDVATQQDEDYGFKESDTWLTSSASSEKSDYVQTLLRSPRTLHDVLLEQLHLTRLPDPVIQAGELIISDIDERGFLKEALADLIDGMAIRLADAERALDAIQKFDPCGCGARNIRESLLIQAKQLHPTEEMTHRILEHHFGELERLDYKKIEKETGMTEQEIHHAIQIIKMLEPFPGHQIDSRKTEYVIPDLIILDREGQLKIVINDEWLPTLQVNEEYRQYLLQNKTREKERDYMQKKLSSAEWLIRSISQRRETLQKVMQSILEYQKEFFLHGTGHLRPMTQKDIAEKTEVHESTVSRITTKKYVQTRWGIFELKYFFSGAIAGHEGNIHSAKNIQERLLKIVQSESPDHVYSDQEIVELLAKEGIQIARRTVAKYRKVLQILPAERRKRLNLMK